MTTRLEKIRTLATLALAAGSACFAAQLNVMVAIPPLAGLVQSVAGDSATVQMLVPKGQDPHVYEPTPRQVAQLAEADIYFGIRLPLENALLAKLSGTHTKMRVRDCTTGAQWLNPDPDQDHEHHCTPNQPHEQQDSCQQGLDPHLWLSPANLAVMASNICAELCLLAPAQAPAFQTGLATTLSRLNNVDNTNRQLLAPFKNRAFLVFHPSFSYFAQQYSLRQESIEIEGKSPSARQIAVVTARAREFKATAIFVQPQFSDKSAAALAAALQIPVVTLDPLDPDVIGNLARIAEIISTHFNPKRTQP